jgi:hypothetical protein
MFHDKEKLLKEVRRHLDGHPEDTREFIGVCAEALDAYAQACRQANDAKAYAALRDVTMVNTGGCPKNLKFASAIDANFIVFRRGWDIVKSGDAVAMVDAFFDFVTAGLEYGLIDPDSGELIKQHERWLHLRGGADMVEWARSIFCVAHLGALRAQDRRTSHEA